MSASIRISVTEDTEKKEITMEVRLEKEGATDLENLVTSRLKPMVEEYLNRFEQIESSEGTSTESTSTDEPLIIIP
jgi:hypothetical protein